MEHTIKNQFFLKKGELLEITSKSELIVTNGLVWVTLAGDMCDYVLKTGDSLKLDGAKPVIEAICSSHVVVKEKPSKYKLLSTVLYN